MAITHPDTKALEKIFNGDLDLMLFYVAWIKNGLNSTKAYLELHPELTRESAQVLGSRQLAKIDRQVIMKSYGLDDDLYFKQLVDGIDATKWNDFTGEREADHKTRQGYHDKLGKLLAIETDKPMNNIVVIPIMKGESVHLNSSDQENISAPQED